MFDKLASARDALLAQHEPCVYCGEESEPEFGDEPVCIRCVEMMLRAFSDLANGNCQGSVVSSRRGEK